MNASELIERIKDLPEGERAKVAQFIAEQNLRATRRTAFLASLTTAFLLLSVLGIVWLCMRPPETPRGATKPSPVASEAPQRVRAIPAAVAVGATLALNIPPRSSLTGSNLVDLSAHYNGDLYKNWHNPGGEVGNDLRELPIGMQTMAGTLFDVRGVIAVNQGSGRGMLPPIVEGIRVGQKCEQLHFLHSAYNAAFSNLEEIGHYKVRLANGEQHVIRIVTGRDVLDWHNAVPTGSPLVIAWEGDNPRTRQRPDGTKKIRLYKTTWENPSPEVEVRTIDFVSRRGAPAPFLVAITVE